MVDKKINALEALDWLIMECTRPFKAGTKSEKSRKQERAVKTIREALIADSIMDAAKGEGNE